MLIRFDREVVGLTVLKALELGFTYTQTEDSRWRPLRYVAGLVYYRFPPSQLAGLNLVPLAYRIMVNYEVYTRSILGLRKPRWAVKKRPCLAIQLIEPFSRYEQIRLDVVLRFPYDESCLAETNISPWIKFVREGLDQMVARFLRELYRLDDQA
ncbi:MAG: hypothetical protein WCX71_02155 [Candidatus Buchananbacteria bacterium]